MYSGARVTDEVSFLQRRGELRGAVKLVRKREPERFRWRTAVSWVSARTGSLFGRERFRMEEPVREMVLELPDAELRREVVLDARRHGVDLDRGEVLPFRSLLDLRRLSFLVGADLFQLGRVVELPTDLFSPVDTAAAVLGCRAIALDHQRRAQRLLLRLPDPEMTAFRLHQRHIADRARLDHDLSKRWAALSRALVDAQA